MRLDPSLPFVCVCARVPSPSSANVLPATQLQINLFSIDLRVGTAVLPRARATISEGLASDRLCLKDEKPWIKGPSRACDTFGTNHENHRQTRRGGGVTTQPQQAQAKSAALRFAFLGWRGPDQASRALSSCSACCSSTEAILAICASSRSSTLCRICLGRAHTRHNT